MQLKLITPRKVISAAILALGIITPTLVFSGGSSPPGIQQSGSVTPGNCAQFAGSGVVIDAGGTCGTGTAGVIQSQGTAGQVLVNGDAAAHTGATTYSLPATITPDLTFSGANAYGTPASITLTNGTGLPISSGVSGLGTGIATWLATPSSANLLAALTTKTGTGSAVFGTSPTISAPTITGVPVMSGLSAGTQVSCLGLDVSNNVVLNAAACGTGSGGSAFNAITGGTNTTAAMVVGTGASLGVTGSGTIGATSLLSQTWANPGTIGGGTPAAGHFTSFSATGALALSGLSSGTQVSCMGLDSGNNVVLNLAACGSGGGGGTVGSGTAGQVAAYPSSGTSVQGYTLGNTFVVDNTGHTINLTSPNRSAAGGATIGSGDIGGQVNSTDASASTFTQPSTGTAGAGQGWIMTDQGAGVVTLSGGQALNGLAASTLNQGGWAACTGNGTNADCFGFPGFGIFSGDMTSTFAGVATVSKVGGDANVAFLDVNQSFTKGQAVTPLTTSPCGTQSAAGTMTMDFSLSNSCVATFGAGNLTIANPSNVKAGQGFVLKLVQDSVGSRTASWGANFKWTAGSPPTLATAANAYDMISCFAPTTSEIDCNDAAGGGGGSVSITAADTSLVVTPSPITGTGTIGSTSNVFGPAATSTGSGNVNITAGVSDEETTGSTSLLAARTWTLPCSTAQPANSNGNNNAFRVLVGDAAGLINGANNIVIAANASSCSDTIDGGANVTIGVAHGGIELEVVGTGYHVVGDTLLQATTATSDQFLTNIDTSGVQQKLQPAYSNLSGSPAATDLLISGGSGANPTGLAPVNGDCAVGSGGAWTTGSCSTGSGTVTILTAGTNVTFSSGSTCTTTCTINASGSGGGGAPANAFINGLLITKHTGANTLDITAGVVYDPSSATVLTCTAQTAMSAGTLGNNQANQVYVTSGSPCTYVVTNNAEPPSSAYYGTAREDGSSRRWIGSFFTDGSGNIIPQRAIEVAAGQVQVMYLASPPTRVVSGITNTSYGSEVSAATILPANVLVDVLFTVQVAGGPNSGNFSIDGTNDIILCNAPVITSPGFNSCPMVTPFEETVPGIWAKSNSGSFAVYGDVNGYTAVR